MKERKIEDTPLLRQYFEVKAQHPEAVLLYRVGDFYETYSTDAELVSRVLGLVLTKKSNGDKGPVPMAGFPHHAIENYLTKLVRAGHKVAVCDQLEDPKLSGRKLVKRGVTELVTPGIAFGEQMLDGRENNYLAGLYIEKDRYGMAVLDVSTGSFRVAEGGEDYISTLFASLNPREVVVPRGFERGVRDKFGDIYISSLDEWAFVYDSAVERLKKQLETESLKGFAIDCHPLGICAAGALLVYLELTRHSGLKNICSISRIDGSDFVWMDAFTLRNLEIFRPASSADGVSLVQTIDRCCSPMGARLLRSWLSMPVMDTEELNRRYDIVEHFTAHNEVLDEVRKALGEVGDIERITGRAATGKISPREVMQLGRGISRCETFLSLCLGKGCTALDTLLSGMTDCSELLGEINRTLDPDPAAMIGKGPVIASGVDADLDELRDLHYNSRNYLLDMQRREAERTGISSLKIAFNNVFGYYIEVRNSNREKVPAEWIRKQTLVNAERYITEELKEYEEKIITAESRIGEIETRIFTALIGKIQGRIKDIQRNSGIIARLDVLAGFAEQAVTHKYCRPVVDDSSSLVIKDGRHPVIENMMGPGEEYVPNDVFLDSESQQVIILTGPNMAGKSALLRQTALIVLMAQTGSFVPAASARLGYFDKIFTRVGAADNISRGESTFMVEMLETSMILHNLSARSLVLLDEIGRGTSTYDGMSIARAIVEYIHEYGHGAKTLFATHYHELNDLADIYPRVKNFHVAVKEKGREVIFLRRLKEGGTEHSFGIHVARMAGMPREVLDSAERTLKSLEGAGRKAETGIIKPHNTPAGRVESDGSLQLSMFQLDDPALEALRDKLKAADLNNMSPLQAFDLLRSMKEELGI